MTLGKAFLVKATGRALTAVKNRTLILDTLAIIFNATQHSGTYDRYYLRFEFLIVHPKWITNLTTDQGLLFIFFFSDIEQQSACAVAYGFASKSHLALVTEKLEALLKAEFSKKRGMGPSSFFGFMRDHKLEDEQLATRCTILRCVGSAAFKGQDLKSKVSWTCYFTIFTYSRSLCGTI